MNSELYPGEFEAMERQGRIDAVIPEQESCDVYDEYGNYKYPDYVELTEPNTATSMPPRIEPDNCGNYVVQPTYEEKLKAEREKIAEDVADKMAYMGSCLNERNIILGIITGKRETLDGLCSICKSESCVSNGTAISKTDYEARLKADTVVILDKIRAEIIAKDKNVKAIRSDGCCFFTADEILNILNKYKEESEG